MAFLTHKPHDSPIHSFIHSLTRSFIDDRRTADRKRVTTFKGGLEGGCGGTERLPTT